ncbi:MAG: hypothetical protein ACR2GC_02745 [Methyloceanibacter sp.]|uniref:hypothetical protein n=1 Tax=Methyloceanibacter sp. TaxID=1965321 RepID=UPI003D9BF99F
MAASGCQGLSKVRADLLAVEGLIAPAVATRARLADLAVLPSIRDEEEALWGVVRDAALFQSGRPVLLMPEEAKLPIGETVIVAWKDSVEAVRAVRQSRFLPRTSAFAW